MASRIIRVSDAHASGSKHMVIVIPSHPNSYECTLLLFASVRENFNLIPTGNVYLFLALIDLISFILKCLLLSRYLNFKND